MFLCGLNKQKKMTSLDIQHIQQHLQQSGLEAIRQELKKLFNRATSASTSDVDLLAIDLFASLVQQYESAIALDAIKIISEKFTSSNVDEVLLSLNILEECMSKCGPKFHSEVGKFRFLNELIRLVSPQYLGDKTPKKIRDKILDLFLLWTICYPHEKKIKEAYDMLLKRGVQHESMKTVQVQSANKTTSNEQSAKNPERKSSLEMSEKLKMLLQSSNPSDHKAANLLIQNMVKEKERRTEVKTRRKLELKEISENANLLKEMLDQLDQDGANGDVSEDVLATVKDLYESVKRLQPTIAIIANEINENELLEDALEVNDLISDVFQNYQRLIFKHQPNSNPNESVSSLIPNVASQSSRPQNAMDELSEIFSNQRNEACALLTPTTAASLDLLEPTLAASGDVNLNSQDAKHKTWQTVKDINNAHYTTKVFVSNAASAPSITSASFSLVQPLAPAPVSSDLSNKNNNLFDSLTSSVDNNSSPRLTAIKKDLPSPSKPPSKLANFDSELSNLISGLKINLTKENETDLLAGVSSNDLEDDEILQVEQIQTTSVQTNLVNTETEKAVVDQQIKAEVGGNSKITNTVKSELEKFKSLAEIYVDLNTIRPHETYSSRCILDDPSGLKIMLNFTKDRPRDDVSVYVITTTNQNRSPITNYQFDASVSRPCKLRLQGASSNELPGVKPFRPPTEDITQILLIANPERKPFKLVCIISYLIENDPDPVKESIEITDLPVALE